MPGRRPSIADILLFVLLSSAATADEFRPYSLQDEESPDLAISVDLNLQVTRDFWTGSRLTDSVKHREAFQNGNGFGASMTASAYLLTGPGWYEDILVSVPYGYMHRRYEGKQTVDEVTGPLRVHDLETDVFYAGLRLGLGSYRPGDCWYAHVYGAFEAGGTRYTETKVDVALPSASTEVLIRNSWSLYLSGGGGVQMVFERHYCVQLEGGYRTYGRPKYGPGAGDHTSDYLGVFYAELSLSLKF